jgi:pimeloyl-ACP methyl ester carboxylesterase
MPTWNAWAEVVALSSPAELQFDVHWGRLAGWAWPQPGKPRMLCLHGWMDNAASFAPLAPLLDDYDLVALEMAGHGHSDHRPPGTNYHFSDHLFDLDAVLDRLGWDECILAGHSMGAGVATCYAAAAPQRVNRLLLLDGLGPLAMAHVDAADQLQRSLQSVRQPRRLERVYADIQAAALARSRRMPMAPQSAELLAARSLQGEPGHYLWRTDPRLLWTSPLRLTERQARDILAAIRCPTLVAITATGEQFMGSLLAERLALMPRARFERVPGGHHFHMDEPQATAQLIIQFLSEHQGAPHAQA